MRPPKTTPRKKQKCGKKAPGSKEPNSKQSELESGPLAGDAEQYSFRELALLKQGYYKTEISKQITEKKAQIRALTEKLRTLPKHRLYFHEIRDLERQLASLHETVSKLMRGVEQEQYCHRLRQLFRSLESIQPASEWKKQEHADDFKRTAKQIFVAEFFPDLTVPTFINKDHCTDCGHPLVLKKQHALLECARCGLSNVYVNTTSSAVSWSQPTVIQKHEYNQMKWMFKQLSQYRIGSRKIPIHVIYAVKRRLLSSHQKTSQCVSHTPIREILRELGYKEYSNSASKIADIINAKRVPEFTDEQFISVIERMLAVQTVYFMVRSSISRANFPNISFLLHQICLIEGWWHLSQCFQIQKTFKVYQQQREEWDQFLPFLQRFDTRHKWIYSTTHPNLVRLQLTRR